MNKNDNNSFYWQPQSEYLLKPCLKLPSVNWERSRVNMDFSILSIAFNNRRFSSSGVQERRIAPEPAHQANEEESRGGLQQAGREEALRPRRRPSGQPLRRGTEKSPAEEEPRA